MNLSVFTIVLILVTAIAIILRLCLPLLKTWQKHEDAWDKRFTFVTAALACAAAIYTIYDTSKNVADNTAQARVAASFEFLRQLDANGFNKYADFRLEAISAKLDPTAIDTKLHREKLDEMVSTVLGNFEDMAVAIKSKYVDEKVLYYEVRNITLWTSTNLTVHINEVRKLRGPSYLDEFDDLVNAWKNGKSLVDGHVFAEKDYSGR